MNVAAKIDAMIPAATSWAQTPAKPVPRLGFVFIPMGCDQGRWTPPGQGKLDELSPILNPLKPVKDQLTVITNMRLPNAYPGTHDTSNSAFLSAATSKHTESSDYYLGTTVDQIAARQMGRETQLASLQLAMDLNPLAGVCNNGYACVYQNCLSWSSPTTPLPSEAHPRLVFERLFGDGGDAASRRASLRSRASLLDSFMEDIGRLKQRVGTPDRVRVDEYLESICEIERQIQRAETSAKDNATVDLDRPVGVPAEQVGDAHTVVVQQPVPVRALLLDGVQVSDAQTPWTTDGEPLQVDLGTGEEIGTANLIASVPGPRERVEQRTLPGHVEQPHKFGLGHRPALAARVRFFVQPR